MSIEKQPSTRCNRLESHALSQGGFAGTYIASICLALGLGVSRGMRAIVLKNHWTETAGLAYLIRKYGERAFEVIRAVGPERTFVGSDSGLTGSPNHPDALAMAARALRDAGFDERALEQMFKTNPARLLGLAVGR
jgi:hypothetical protein